MDGTESNGKLSDLNLRHRRWGWWQLFVFLTVGVVLESFHGLKIGFYLDPGNEIRREMWRLAHAHGTLTGTINILFALSLSSGHWRSDARARLASGLLTIGSLLLPLGFILGGAAPSETDPWIGVWLVPVGALFLVIAILVTAMESQPSQQET